MTTEWTEAEPGWREFVGELRRLYRRNRGHPLPLVSLVLLLTTTGFLYGFRVQPNYVARIALRLTEHDVGVSVSPRPIGELRAFVQDVALSDRVLERIMTRFGLYKSQRARGIDQALQAIREDIGVEVWRNEFLVQAADDVGRSARVALTYANSDPAAAWGVVEALAEAALAEQRRVRRAQAEYLAMGLEPALIDLDRRLGVVKQKLGAAAVMSGPLGATHFAQLRGDLEALETHRSELSERRNEALLRLRAETLNLSLRSDVIDSTRPTHREHHRMAALVGAALGLFVGLLLGSIVIKAFDRRIYDEEDLQRIGFTLCGALPPFPGDGVGSMRSRVRMTHR